MIKNKIKSGKFYRRLIKYKAKIILVLLIFLILLSFIVHAQTQQILGTITQQSLNLLNLPPAVKTILDVSLCATLGGTSCLINVGKGLITQAIIDQLPEDLQKVISVYNKIQPLIKNGNAIINRNINVGSDGEIIEGELELKNGEETDISDFFSDLKEGEKVSATNLIVSKDKQSGATTLFFDKEGGKLKIGENVFEHIAPGKNKDSFIKLNNKGSVLEANFYTDNVGGNFNVNGIKFHAPANSLVNYRAGTITPGKLIIQVPDGSKFSEIPTFDKERFGNVEINLKEGSFFLPDGTKVSGVLMYSDVIPEGYIPPLREATFNDRIKVKARSHPIKLTKDIKIGESNFYLGQDYNIAYGEMDISVNMGGSNNVFVDLRKSGITFTTNNGNFFASTFIYEKGFSLIYVGGKKYTFSGDKVYEYQYSEFGRNVGYNIDFYNSGKKVDTREGVTLPPPTSDSVSLSYSPERVYASQNSRTYSNNNPKINEPIRIDRSEQPDQLLNIKSLFPDIEKVTITSKYGSRRDPTSPQNVEFHPGIDIAAPIGSKVYPFKPGRVVFAKKGYSGSGFGGYGNVVAIQHDDGLISVYAHGSEILVSEGDVVREDTPILKVGSTGKSTGPHLHFEIRRSIEYGTSVNPKRYISF